MRRRCLRGFVILLGLGLVASIGGCGSSSEEGTMVKVDKEKEDMMLKKMEDYMNKHGSPEKTRKTLAAEAKEKKQGGASPDR